MNRVEVERDYLVLLSWELNFHWRSSGLVSGFMLALHVLRPHTQWHTRAQKN